MENPIDKFIKEIERMQAAGTLTGEVDTLIHIGRKIEKDVFGILKRPYRFEVWQSKKNKQWLGRLVGPNGKIMDSTEPMKARASVLKNFRRKQAAYLCAELEVKG